MKEESMRLMRRSLKNHLKWSHSFLILTMTLTGFSLEMGFARRSKYQDTDSNPGSAMSNRRNTQRDRLYYNPNPTLQRFDYMDPLRKTQDLKRGLSDPNMYFRSPDEPVLNTRRGTSTSTVESSYLSTFDNTLNNKLFDSQPDHYVTSIISASETNKGSRNPNNNNNGNNKKQRRKSYPPRPASVNSILRVDPQLSLWDESTAICRSIPGLTKDQMELCFRNPETTTVALQGLSLAADECAYQMSKNRWNCSSLQGRMNPHSTVLFKKGYRESAFGHAIASAGVAYSVAKACSQGNLLSCGCGFQYDDQVNYITTKDTDYGFEDSSNSAVKRWTGSGGRTGLSSWKWSGCSHNMNYGVRFAKLFLDARERSTDLPSRINLHNNRVGRMAVASNMEVRCKCHGLSGSCELRTCWRSAPDFRQVGTVLKNKFRRAVMIDQSELGNRPLNRVQKANKERRKRRDRSKRNTGNIDLWYYERSPTYCESNIDFSIPGTSGRVCNKTGGREMGSCNTLCCGRGYNTIRHVYSKRCNCRFHWCCNVECQTCVGTEEIYTCK